MFPWLAQDHISPFSELAKKLSQKNFHISKTIGKTSVISPHNQQNSNYHHGLTFLPHYHITKMCPLLLRESSIKPFNCQVPAFQTSSEFMQQKSVLDFIYLLWQQIVEMARDLVLCDVNFIWVIRFPVGKTIGKQKALPERFLERAQDWGYDFARMDTTS